MGWCIGFECFVIKRVIGIVIVVDEMLLVMRYWEVFVIEWKF